jgi:branched-chain amino acid transport system ATP-binding protein
MPLLKTENLNVSHGVVQVLWNVDVEVNEGEITSIVGANGAGKSTMMRAISGVIRPKSGSIYFRDEPIHQLKSSFIVELGVILIPEGRLIFPEMTVLENLEIGSYIKRAKVRRAESLEFVFSLFPILAERKSQIAGTLSGGEQQMLAIGRGLMSLPELLMLDEISLGLAPNLVAELFRVVRQINTEGVTILLVEQNVMHALNFSDRAYVVENGRIVMEGASKDILENPHVKSAYLGI